mmetsp:Transcript_64322/g.199162  ORF Transcript_64322/g.199162 Transcript_64322/m.199162 type:complete len:246 (+) Transcript_64322:622-1359(+)
MDVLHRRLGQPGQRGAAHVDLSGGLAGSGARCKPGIGGGVGEAAPLPEAWVRQVGGGRRAGRVLQPDLPRPPAQGLGRAPQGHGAHRGVRTDARPPRTRAACLRCVRGNCSRWRRRCTWRGKHSCCAWVYPHEPCRAKRWGPVGRAAGQHCGAFSTLCRYFHGCFKVCPSTRSAGCGPCIRAGVALAGSRPQGCRGAGPGPQDDEHACARGGGLQPSGPAAGAHLPLARGQGGPAPAYGGGPRLA